MGKLMQTIGDFIDFLDVWDLTLFFTLILGIIVVSIALFIWDYFYFLNTLGIALIGISLGYFIARGTL